MTSIVASQASTAATAEVMDTDPTASTSTRRLIITKLVVENFKSYAGRQEIGPFHKVILNGIKPVEQSLFTSHFSHSRR
jgi:hypothetical protein